MNFCRRSQKLRQPGRRIARSKPRCSTSTCGTPALRILHAVIVLSAEPFYKECDPSLDQLQMSRMPHFMPSRTVDYNTKLRRSIGGAAMAPTDRERRTSCLHPGPPSSGSSFDDWPDIAIAHRSSPFKSPRRPIYPARSSRCDPYEGTLSILHRANMHRQLRWRKGRSRTGRRLHECLNDAGASTPRPRGTPRSTGAADPSAARPDIARRARGRLHRPPTFLGLTPLN